MAKLTYPAERSRALAWLLAAAFVVKMAVLLQLHGHPLLQPHGELDTAYYVELGQQVARNGLAAGPESLAVSPLYAYFLGGIFSLGGGLFAARLVQVVLGTAAVGLTFATARIWFGGYAAAIAAALAILTGLFTFYEVLILQAAIDPFLVALTLYLVTKATDTDERARLSAPNGVAGSRGARLQPDATPKPTPGVAAAAGISLGLLALNRPNALAYAVLVVALVAASAWRRRDDRRGAILRAAALAAGLALTLGTNALRTYAVSGEVVLIASHGGLNFYIGNHEGASGTYSPVPGISPSIAGQARDAARLASETAGRPLTPGEVSGHFYGRAWDWMMAHPRDALRLAARKLAILVNRIDVPLNHSYAYYAREESALLRALAVGPWLLFPLGLVGLLWSDARQRSTGYWAWGAFVPVVGLTVVAFFVSSRYRMPMLVPLCAAAGACVARMAGAIRARSYASLLAPVLAVAAVALPVGWNLGLDDGVGGEQTRKAVWLVEQRSFDEARRYVDRISPGHSHPGVLAFRVGQALADAGRYGDAAVHLRQALTIDGPRPAVLLALGEALGGAARWDEAATHLAAACESGYRTDVSCRQFVRALVLAGRPDLAAARVASLPEEAAGGGVDAALDFGTLALERGAPAAAERWLRLAVSRAPLLAEAHEKLGLSFLLRGRAADALSPLVEACRLEPGRASAHLNLAVVYAELGRIDEARRHATEAARLDPGEPRVRDLLTALPRQAR